MKVFTVLVLAFFAGIGFQVAEYVMYWASGLVGLCYG